MSRTRAVAMGCFLAITALAPMAAPAVATHPVQATLAAPGGKALERVLAARRPPLGMMVTLQRDLGLTTDQAQSRLLNEIRLAPIAAQLRRRLGTRFAGSWLLGTTAHTLVVATTSSADAAQITAQGAQPLLVRRSLEELQAIKERLATTTRPALSSVSGVRYVDVRTRCSVGFNKRPRASCGTRRSRAPTTPESRSTKPGNPGHWWATTPVAPCASTVPGRPSRAPRSAWPGPPAPASTGTAAPSPSATSLDNAQSVHQPGGLYYRTTATGSHYGCLASDAGRDFDLYLQKRTGSSWSTVAASSSPNPFEELGYWGPPGDYRYLVISAIGAGPYGLGYTTP
ncbi:hypothetical protein [Streptosporangium sp. LJ11]|uniref:hypothetical protein n=1 Tax=Streptosporangium sp. LJ11 TaxID=3436927 RepID=UPI003F797425